MAKVHWKRPEQFRHEDDCGKWIGELWLREDLDEIDTIPCTLAALTHFHPPDRRPGKRRYTHYWLFTFADAESTMPLPKTIRTLKAAQAYVEVMARLGVKESKGTPE
jgi:hypothetical protein